MRIAALLAVVDLIVGAEDGFLYYFERSYLEASAAQ